MLKRIRSLLESAKRVKVLEAQLSNAQQTLVSSADRNEVRKDALNRIRYAVSAAPINSLDHATQLLALIERIAKDGYAGRPSSTMHAPFSIPAMQTALERREERRPLPSDAPSGVMAMAREQRKREFTAYQRIDQEIADSEARVARAKAYVGVDLGGESKTHYYTALAADHLADLPDPRNNG